MNALLYRKLRNLLRDSPLTGGGIESACREPGLRCQRSGVRAPHPASQELIVEGPGRRANLRQSWVCCKLIRYKRHLPLPLTPPPHPHPPLRRKLGANKCPVEDTSPIVCIFIVAWGGRGELRKGNEGGKERKSSSWVINESQRTTTNTGAFQ